MSCWDDRHDADPRGRYGVASLTSAMLTEGAGSRSAVEIADALDALLANLSASSSPDASSVQLYVPVGRLGDALSLMADVAQRPTFPKPALERLRGQRIATLRKRAAIRLGCALAFAAESTAGTPQRRGAHRLHQAPRGADAEDLRAFHASVYRPGKQHVDRRRRCGCGAVLPLLETHFGKWQPASAGAVVREPAPPLQRPARQLTHRHHERPQSAFYRQRGRVDAMSDFFAMQVLSTWSKPG